PGTGTNQFIEVVSAGYDYGAGLLTFHDHVQAGFVEGETIRGTLEAGTLKAFFTPSNQVQKVTAETEVYARLLPVQKVATGKTVEKDLRCDFLSIQLRTNSLIEEIVAQRKVYATQTEIRTNGAA